MLDLNWTNLSRFVKAAVSGGFDVRIVFLVLRRWRPGIVGGWGRQQQEERKLRAPVVQEGEGAICLHHRWGKPTIIPKGKWLLKLLGFFFNQYFRFYLWLFWFSFWKGVFRVPEILRQQKLLCWRNHSTFLGVITEQSCPEKRNLSACKTLFKADEAKQTRLPPDGRPTCMRKACCAHLFFPKMGT